MSELNRLPVSEIYCPEKEELLFYFFVRKNNVLFLKSESFSFPWDWFMWGRLCLWNHLRLTTRWSPIVLNPSRQFHLIVAANLQMSLMFKQPHEEIFDHFWRPTELSRDLLLVNWTQCCATCNDWQLLSVDFFFISVQLVDIMWRYFRFFRPKTVWNKAIGPEKEPHRKMFKVPNRAPDLRGTVKIRWT